VQVAVQTTGLCGSDLHYFNHYRNGDILVRQPLTLGHESAGVVTAVGSEVSNLKIGDRVALEVGLPCLECGLCREGRYNICKSLRFRSSAKSFPHFQGTLQKKINHPAVYCHKWDFPGELFWRVLTFSDFLPMYLKISVPFSSLLELPSMLQEELH
jgi:L-iditol 2-dehydrogenase